ncbi:MAG TPA: hypothetical protein VNY05_24830 [Candidatus Acidoferrales bacterium]|jgi:hypothetical protein|nr:hypothetical protein [Candidatus Acidoferrales bacterium]
MPSFHALRAAVCTAVCCLFAQAQDTPPNPAQTNPAQTNPAPTNQTKGMPPRATPAEYQTQAQAGTVTIAAEFKGHSVPTMQGPLTSEDYVVVETALFGPPEARIKLSAEDFSLRINAKKAPLPSLPYGLVVGSVKDPEWEPPVPVEKKSKTGLNTGGKGDQGDSTPAPVKIPIEVQRAMAQRVQKASLPEGDRALPQAGLLFFQYRGNARSIHSVELIYTGPAGKVTLPLQP